ncbi:putative disease resistance protein At5g47280 [Magnolia sinica]|uniref:putative disease resistance protein At5g47280 n=1 Tax=Magnolia sinica TaxID=86752 RepID=UPI0026580313|nr:putative disease resistance protein At5g47280 [Magnolia sinica]
MGADFFLGEVVLELLKELAKLCVRACYVKSSAEQFKHSIDALLPIIQEIQYSGVELPQHRQSQLDELAQKLRHGLDLVRRASSSSRWNVYKNIQLAKQMEKVDKSVSGYMKWMQAHVMADVHHVRVGVLEYGEKVERIGRKLEECIGAVKLGEGNRKFAFDDGEENDGVGVLEGFGMRFGLEKVKEMLLTADGEGEKKVRVVGVCGIGGSGKTTLVKKLCQDFQIRSHFENRVIFETVSQSPNVESLRAKIWEQITGNRFGSANDQIPQWMVRFEQSIRRPTLVVLDDIWSLSVLEQLISKIPGCITLAVSRFKYPVFDQTYEVELMGEEEALSLFCLAAFQQQSIPPTADKKLVNQVVAECKGLPLALKVIGASLRNRPPLAWVSAKNRLSRGESISETHEANFFERMAISIECLDPKVQECFLDLGSFPEDKKIPLDVLINMWVEMHDLDEEDAFVVLGDLSEKNLLSHVQEDAQGRAGDIYSSYSEFSVAQHDVLRDLALHMCNRENVNRRKRLIMARREDGLPKDWQRNKDKPFDARIVSIHTGEMKESDWFLMNFPNTEVLILRFSSSTYFLPPFIELMPKLKSLILVNYGASSAVLHNLSVFDSLDSLKSLWLEKIIVPHLRRTTVPLPSLRKISLVLCEVTKSLNGSSANLPCIFPCLSHLTIDHCIDLTKLPPTICGVRSLESLSITNCHNLCELPSELGQLNSLQILRLYACPALKKLPQAICGLKKLKYLDIYQCINLRNLPDGMGQLISLEKIDMRECSLIRNLPGSAMSLRSLDRVICDEEIGFLWKEASKALPELRVQVAEKCFTLNWLME